MEIPSLFHCTVLISCLLISSSRGPLCFIILLSGGVPAKFLPFASGCSCTLALPFCLLSTGYCFCMLMKGPAPPPCSRARSLCARGGAVRAGPDALSAQTATPALEALRGLALGSPTPGGGGFHWSGCVCTCAQVSIHSKCSPCGFNYFSYITVLM